MSTAATTQHHRHPSDVHRRRRTASASALEAADLHHVTVALHGFIAEAVASTPSASSLWEAVRLASEGGKMIRPRLLMTTHRALGGADEAGAVRASAGLELLHTAFLIHDDVIDHDWERRGRPNVAGSFRDAAVARGRGRVVAEHLGASAALIAGDLALAGAVRLVGSATSDPATNARLATIVDAAVSATAAGELMDVELAASDRPGLDAVLAMYEAKTSAYTFCAPLQAAAVLAGADPAVVDALQRAGRALGVAYQIADDLLGLFGDPAVTGKSVVSDAREGKRTVLATLSAERDRPAARGPAGDAQDAADLRHEVERSGARAAAAELAAAHVRDARQALRSVPAAVGDALEPLLGGVATRMS